VNQPSSGIEVIKKTIPTLPTSAGVYRMCNTSGDVLYVGKARNLKRRVNSYTQLKRLPLRLQRMVAQTDSLEIVTTHTEAEALLLESNLIKRFTPYFNVLLRDDKSFPYILLTNHLNRKLLLTGDSEKTSVSKHTYSPKDTTKKGANPEEWIGITKYRGTRSHRGEYFGPFASPGAVNRTLNALERAFLLRSCSDSVFSGRTRPCLKYQLKRCSAPCVGLISLEDYKNLIQQAREFLGGQSRSVQEKIAKEMHRASQNLEYEAAGQARDRIRALTQIQAHQDINVENLNLPEADIIAGHQINGQTCVQVFFFRAGRNYGNRAYFPRHDKSVPLSEVLTAFIGQFYADKTPPRLILSSQQLPENAVLCAALSVKANHKIQIVHPKRGARKKIVQHAVDNARDAMERRLAEKTTNEELLKKAADLFKIKTPIKRIEVYDNSHVSGQYAVGAMIVAGPNGFIKGAYRKFNMKDSRKNKIDGYTAGNDLGMMNEMLTRRFSRALKEKDKNNYTDWPNLILIDGGLTQLNTANNVLKSLGIKDIVVVGIAKGPERNAGREKFYLAEKAAFQLPQNDGLLYYFQRLRDEAHRFAISTHRAKRSKSIYKNPLDEVSGIGAKRKKALLLHFGSARAVTRAGLADLEGVSGISKSMAKQIYYYFNANS
jgi:excinuclease ABC subunit C|tara:strand:+ start:7383 stop:9359 length:1977 start_codon:yes stop_codon:yes gene_type:complete